MTCVHSARNCVPPKIEQYCCATYKHIPRGNLSALESGRPIPNLKKIQSNSPPPPSSFSGLPRQRELRYMWKEFALLTPTDDGIYIYQTASPVLHSKTWITSFLFSCYFFDTFLLIASKYQIPGNNSWYTSVNFPYQKVPDVNWSPPSVMTDGPTSCNGQLQHHQQRLTPLWATH